jgi:thymidylate synthase (FAD)
VNVCQDSYDSLVALGVKAEDARSVLPINCTCNLTVSCNLRAFLDFWSKRKPGTHAQDEIQELAVKMKDEIIGREPWIEGLIKG